MRVRERERQREKEKEKERKREEEKEGKRKKERPRKRERARLGEPETKSANTWESIHSFQNDWFTLYMYLQNALLQANEASLSRRLQTYFLFDPECSHKSQRGSIVTASWTDSDDNDNANGSDVGEVKSRQPVVTGDTGIVVVVNTTGHPSAMKVKSTKSGSSGWVPQEINGLKAHLCKLVLRD